MTFVTIAALLAHSDRHALHPHLLALIERGEVRPGPAPILVTAKEFAVSDARSGATLPLVGDLSVLKSADSQAQASQAPLSPPPPSSIGAGVPKATGLELPRDKPAMATQNPMPGERPPSNQPANAAMIGETQLSALYIAPLEVSITAQERDYENLGQHDPLCELLDKPQPMTLPKRLAPEVDFGRALANAALQQTGDFVVYTDKYRHMSFPMGDVPAMFGVCTDVVIRAYRAVGIDLQAQIHAARIGSGDKNIAHRRTFTLRRYFASRGASLPITDFAEDYLPGDVVTYHRPQNRGSRDHIAIVTDVVASSGRPMIVHNRGWGPQLEDALFVDRITGHYRYRGQMAPILLQSKARISAAGTETIASAERPSPETRSVIRTSRVAPRIRRLKGRTGH